ncbi:hypothetical protein DASC09_058580 [Saccharomycopsis crataegensis]|uniref:DASH complex subunit DUO1 n=1 Tax=Saccharomycopsis crataegensis TaxID=43959 RepID=A0AAV5QVH6_9ASCO|nr:hypothetical protein DASC09_058580 [Saccharomycopsis crataegensis]
MSSLENRISADLKTIKANLDQIRDSDEFTGTTTISNALPLTQVDEITKLKLINSLLANLSSTLDTIQWNINQVDESLKVTNQLIDKWAKILVKNGEISELLLSQSSFPVGGPSDYKWKGSTTDNMLYKEKVTKYNNLVNKYNGLKQAREATERKLRQQEELRMRKIKEREEILQRRVYGSKYRSKPPGTRSRITKK